MTIDYESLLSLAEIRRHTRTDDDVYVTDEELSFLRESSFEELKKYNRNVDFGTLRDVQQQVLLKQDAGGFMADQKIDLDYPVTSAGVTLVTAKIAPMFFITAYEARFVYVTSRIVGQCCALFTPQAILYYSTGSKNPRGLSANLKLGCLRFIDYALNVRNNGVVTKDLVINSGAYKLWK